jgi:trimeric autotransporter adhesin
MKKMMFTVMSILFLNLTSFAQWSTSGTNIFNSNTGNVGIGNTAPTAKLDIVGSGSGNTSLITVRNNSTSAIQAFSAGDINFLNSAFVAQRSRGTFQSPTNVIAGDRLGLFSANGYSGTSFSTQGAMEMYVGSSLGTYIIFGTTATPGASRLEQMRITETGNVGIGFTAPSQKLDVNGSVRGVSFISFSDERFKTNIRKFENPLDKLIQIQGVRYQFNKRKFSNMTFPDGERDGLLAQQVQKVFPELVTADADGYLAVDYVSMIPILIESIKELKTKIDLLKAERIQNDLTIDQKKIADRFKGAFLNQNAPNPSTNGASIEFFIPENASTASIVIHDNSGNQIKKYDITERGQGKIDIQNGEFGSGIFLYTLLLDGSVLDVKRMILTKN